MQDVRIKLPTDECSFVTKSTEDWYVPFTDYWIDRCKSVNTKRMEIINEQYKILTHDISDSHYREIMQVLQQDLDVEKLKEFRHKKQDFNIINKIVKKYIGEYLTKNNNFQVYNEEASIVMKRNDHIAQIVADASFQKFVNILNEQGVQTGVESKEQPKIEDIVKEESEKYLQVKAEEARHRIDLLLQLADDAYKFAQMVYHYTVTDNMFTYIYIQDSDVFYDVIPPNEFYPLQSGTGFVEDSPAVMRMFNMRLSDVLTKFADTLSKTQIKSLKDYIYKYETENEMFDGTLDIQENGGIITIKDTQSNRTKYEFTDRHLFTRVYHVQAHSLKKIGVLEFLDFETNTITTKDVSEDYKFDKAFGDLSIAWEYIPCIYETWRIGNDNDVALYIKPQELEVQREHLSIKGKTKNSYYGITNILDGFPYTPLPGRLLPYQVEYEIVRFKRKQTIAKFKPMIQYIPETALMESDEFTLAERYSKMMSDDILIVNDDSLTQQAATILQLGIRNTVEKYIDSLTNIMKSIEQEILDEADMSPVRYGNASPYMSQGLAEQQVNYATISNVLAVQTFTKARINQLEALIDYSKIAWIGGKKGLIRTDFNNVKEVVVDGVDNFNENVGIFIKDIVTEGQKIQQIKQLAQTAAQSGQLDMMVEFITNDDIPSLKKNATALMQAERDMKMQMEQYQVEAQKLKNAMEEKKIATERENLVMTEQGAMDRIKMQGQIDMILQGISGSLDSSGNDKMNKLNLDNEKLNFQKQAHSENLAMKDKTLASQERVATTNKN